VGGERDYSCPTGQIPIGLFVFAGLSGAGGLDLDRKDIIPVRAEIQNLENILPPRWLEGDEKKAKLSGQGYAGKIF